MLPRVALREHELETGQVLVAEPCLRDPVRVAGEEPDHQRQVEALHERCGGSVVRRRGLLRASCQKRFWLERLRDEDEVQADRRARVAGALELLERRLHVEEAEHEPEHERRRVDRAERRELVAEVVRMLRVEDEHRGHHRGDGRPAVRRALPDRRRRLARAYLRHAVVAIRRLADGRLGAARRVGRCRFRLRLGLDLVLFGRAHALC